MALFDLSGIFQVQRALLADISSTYTGTGTNAALNSSMSALQTKLDSLNTNLQTGSASLNYALTRQKDVKTILDKEKQRLDAKKSQITDYHGTVIRSSELNDNIRKKQASFIKVFLIIIGLTLLYIVLIKVNQTIPFPEYLMEFIMVFLFSLGGIYLYLVLRDIYTRSNMDFDKLHLPPPNTVISPDKIDSAKQKAKNQGSLLGSLIGDIGDYTKLGIRGSTIYAPSLNRYIKVCSSDKPVYDLSGDTCIADATPAETGYTYCGTNPKVRVPTTGNDRTNECVSTFSTQQDPEDMNSVQPYAPSEKNDYGFL